MGLYSRGKTVTPDGLSAWNVSMLIFLPFISSVDASFRSKWIHTLAVGCVKSHFLFAGVRCCWVIVHLDLASYLALLTGRAILVTAYITIYSKFNPNLSVLSHFSTVQFPQICCLVVAP